MHLYILICLSSITVAIGLTCAILLWRIRKEVQDYSRTILSVFCLVCSFVLSVFLFGIISNKFPFTFNTILPPEMLILGLLAITINLGYPLEVMRPRQLKGPRTILLFIPWLIITLPIVFGMKVQELHSLSELWAHWNDPDVLLRFLAILFLLTISLLMLLIPYNWRKSSAETHWIRRMTLFAQAISIVYCLNVFTGLPIFLYLNIVIAGVLVIYLTYFEMCIRVLPPKESTSAPPAPTLSHTVEPAPEGNDYWKRILQAMDEWEEWRNPNTTVETLSQALGTNRIYVARSIHDHTDMTFNDFLNKKRIDFMAAQLRQDPTQDHKSLYFDAGYRSRQTATAYRNFVKFMGCSPTDYVATLSHR